jgi:signal transduction histidine kinase
MTTAAAVTPPIPAAASRVRRASGEAAYLLTGMLAAVVGFAAWVVGVTLSLTLGLVIVGFPILMATLTCFRWLADIERRRAALVLGTRLPSSYRPTGGRMPHRLKAMLHDPQHWRDTAYLALIGPVGLAKGLVALALWACALACFTLPAWWWAVPGGIELGLFEIDSWQLASMAVALGAAGVPLALAAQRAMAHAQGAMARALLAPSLAARVEQLTHTRAGALDAAAAELRRIERDLHDGAQARLVALAMDLGMAEERFDRDPEGARELVGEARQEARRALAELRDLARGIRPSVLAERGLGAAIAALAARSPIPARATVDVPRRLPAAVESAAWFVVSEALANAGKHSGAGRATVLVVARNGVLRVEVVDDGGGGADPHGAGLTGLAQRVAALDGTLEVNSPPGGPTVVRAVVPCAS